MTYETNTDPTREATMGGGRGFLRETAVIIVSALALSWVIKSFLMMAFYIPSSSMEDTLEVGDRVLVSRLVPRMLDVHRGDIIVFKDPGGWLGEYSPPDRGPALNAVTTALSAIGLLPQDTGEHLVKRVIGLPGDRVACDGDRQPVTVNGVALDETYLAAGATPSQTAFDVTVPDGMLFVMGDNRQNSADSRYNEESPGGAFVPNNNVVGTAFATMWPLENVTLHRNPGAVFDMVTSPERQPY